MKMRRRTRLQLVVLLTLLCACATAHGAPFRNLNFDEKMIESERQVVASRRLIEERLGRPVRFRNGQAAIAEVAAVLVLVGVAIWVAIRQISPPGVPNALFYTTDDGKTWSSGAISKAMTLQAGDVIVSGTPAGVGFAREPKTALSR